jgi:hypothetical protein
VALCLAALAGPAATQAAQRYAAPNGTGTECSQAAPCSLGEGANNASNGDEVIVAPGEYTVTGAPLNVVYAGLQLHGAFGGPMPRVVAELGGLPAIQMSGVGSVISYLEVQNTETEAVGIRCLEGTRLERVRATGIGEGAAGARVYSGCAARDSLFQAQGTNSLAMESLGMGGSTGSDVRNVTAVATGADSAGIQSRYSESNPGSHTLTLTNSIAQGASDLRTEDSNGTGRIVVSNSNFDVVKEETVGAITGSANQSAPPLFVGAGDYREAPGSPTIDAGIAEAAMSPLDLAGNPRALGSAPDIGAFEFVPPSPAAAALIALSVSPKSFRPRASGAAIVSKAKAKRGGATVRYELTGADAVEFTVERKLPGRRIGGKCRKQTAANRGKKKCVRYRALKGGFTDQGVAGPNAFRFSGRVHGKALKPGKYRLVGHSGVSVKRAGFRIIG